MSKLNSVVTQMVVYPIGKNPIYDEDSITITITDEAGGPFLLLSQITADTLEPNEVRIELDELDLVHSKAHVMMQQYESAIKLGEKDEPSKG